MSLSFLAIDDSLRELVAAHEEINADLAILDAGGVLGHDAEELRASLAEVERLLVAYASQYVGKVDSMYYYLQASDVEMKAAKDEAARCMHRAKRIEQSRERLKSIIKQVMIQAGKKRIDGTAGKYIGIQANGGLAPLQVDGWDDAAGKWRAQSPLPDEFRTVVVKMPLEAWNKLSKNYAFGAIHISIQDEPANTAIRDALAEDCPCCIGGKVLDAEMKKQDCSACGGTGKRVVPGARLGERGQQLRLR